MVLLKAGRNYNGHWGSTHLKFGVTLSPSMFATILSNNIACQY